MIQLTKDQFDTLLIEAWGLGNNKRPLNFQFLRKKATEMTSNNFRIQNTNHSAARDCIMAEHNWRKECLS